jgi:hypothetical protein
MKNVAILVAVFLGVIVVKLIFFPTPKAEADLLFVKSARVDVSDLHQTARNLPVQKFHDMTLVFPGGD